MQKETIEGFRLSPQQAHLWLLQQGGQQVPYRALGAISIAGTLHIPMLHTALKQVVRRHEILRTTFRCLPTMTLPLQVITDRPGPSLRVDTGRHWEAQDPEDKVEALWREASRLPFDVEHGPLLQASLVWREPHQHLLLLGLPALCADAVGLENVVREISRCYAACLRGEELPDEPLQYADLAEWQHELLTSEETAAGRAYWRQQPLADLRLLKLPFEQHPSGPTGHRLRVQNGFAPQCLAVTIERALVEQLEALARQQETSTAVVLLACWQILLWRLIGQSDITVGTLYDGRKYDELKAALGLLARYVPVPSRLQEYDPFRRILAQVHTTMHELYKWQEYFTWEHGQQQESPGTSFFPFCFECAEPSAARYPAGDVTFAISRQYTCIDRFNMKLACEYQDGTLTAAFHYDAQLFVPEDIAPLTQQFLTLLHSVTRHPDTALSALEMVSAAERHHLVVRLNATQRPYATHKLPHHLVEEQAARQPDAIAVVVEDQYLSYGALNQRANQLAHHLQKLGVRSEVLVGICVERSPELLVGILGVLKAGGAYVPLDPVLPRERLAYMVEEARPLVLVSQERLRACLPAHQAQVLCLDTAWAVISQESNDNALSSVRPENVVYVLFTSGSTGRPKGVAVAHQHLGNYVHSIVERLTLPTEARYATVSTFAADLGHTAVFPALCTGGCLHVVLLERAADPAALAEYFGRHAIDCLKIVPSHLAALLASSHSAHVVPRQRLVLGGEAARWEMSEQVQALAPECLVFNHYGPTETTVGVLTYRVENGQPAYHTATVPLGTPLGNTQIYLLDAHLRPVPTWVPGEIYIGGANVGRGYLHQPELTAERFLPDPFSAEPGARVYRTGDMARYLPDGNVEFLGRIDQQVKVRGFRIELGEIETVLRQHPAVQESVVVVREEVEGEKRLVAYVVGQQETALATSELRRFVQERLPDYMVPSALVQLDVLPRTPNGKVDRQALPAPEEVRSEVTAVLVMPRTVLEELVAGLWAEVLGAERVGVHDDFFALGGHSLMATQLISRVREACQVELPLRSLFDAPTVAGMAEWIEAATRVGAEVQALPLTRLPRDGDLPLSFAQQRLWFLDQMEPGSAFYNTFAPVRLQGPLNVMALEQTFTEIVRRHEVLRTTFPTVEGRPHQVIAGATPMRVPVVDLQELPQGERESAAQRLAIEEVQRPFDLAQGPLCRVMMLRLEAAQHIGLITMHHIVSDGWSLGILIREVAALYDAFSTGKLSPLPDLPIQYADFAQWQHQWLRDDVLERQLAYWTHQLGGTLPVLQLPTDRPRPAVQQFRGARQFRQFSPDLSAALRGLSRREGVTLFMLLLAAFKALLSRYTRQEDLIVGSPVANRNRVEIEGLVGFFVNTLVLRTDLSGNPSMRELMRRVRTVVLEASTHQDLPFEKLVDMVQPERDLSHTPLFQVVFLLQNAPRQVLQLPGLTLHPLEIEGGTAKFDLTLAMTDTAQGLSARMEYNSDLFDAVTISAMLGHLQTVLEGLVENPDRRLADVPLLTAGERQQVLQAGNTARPVFPTEVCLHQRFAAQAAHTPEAIAVVCEDAHLTYQELNRRTNQLAHHLQRLGVGPDVPVGLYLERSVELVVGILGILKAGGAYVPLDPASPPERVRFMLKDTQAPVLVTHRSLVAGVQGEDEARGALPPLPCQVLCLDEALLAPTSAVPPASGVTAANLAYVIYTSGSTGTPKGVAVSHANVGRLFAATQDWYGCGADDVWTLFHSVAFDFSVWELWGALLYGGRLVVVPYWVSRAPEAFYALVSREQVTVLNQTPSAFRQFIRAEETADTAADLALRLVIFGGEALDLASLQPWVARHGDQRPQLVNMYGITETTVHVTYRPVTAAECLGPAGSVIGMAIPDLSLYVLDAHLQPVPLGVPGELYVGGAGVARGYLQRPELSAERFVPDPYGSMPGARLYKTGDLVRFRPEGDLEYLGRIDQQVKIRGFRIELGEIEAALGQHAAIREAVVLAREDHPGEKRLVAYVVAAPAPVPSISDLRAFLQGTLPDYMVPAAFVWLEAFPLTSNGKVDRRALPAPETARPELQAAFVTPRTPVEERLAEIWAQVLGLERVGVYDNFFELGGDSILSIQIIAKANQAGLRLTPKQIFQYQRIAELARVVGTAGAIQAEQGLVTGTVPLTPIQHWFFEQRLPDPHHWNQAVVLEVRQALTPALLERAVRYVLEHHDALRLLFVPGTTGWQQVIAAPAARVPFTCVDVSELPAQGQGRAVEASAAALQASLNLTAGPLLRVAFFDLGTHTPGRLMLVIHHLAIDGVSWRILMEDLQTSYEHVRRGEVIVLPPKTTSFKHWAQRLTEYAPSDALQAELDFWLATARTQVTPLPVEYPVGRRANTEASSCTVAVALREEETRALLHEVPEAYHTQINDVLLTALVQTFAPWTGRRSLLVDLEGHGREALFEEVDLSRTVGWFTTMCPVLLDLEHAAGPGEALQAVKEQLRRVPHRGIGYGVLRYLSNDPAIATSLRALPQAEVSFNYLGQFDQVLPEGALFGPARESSRPTHSPRGTRKHLLEVRGSITGGQLHVVWTYSAHLHQGATIERLAREYITTLRSLIRHCQSPDAGGYTPSDFPLAQLNQDELEKAFAEAEFEGN